MGVQHTMETAEKFVGQTLFDMDVENDCWNMCYPLINADDPTREILAVIAGDADGYVIVGHDRRTNRLVEGGNDCVISNEQAEAMDFCVPSDN